MTQVSHGYKVFIQAPPEKVFVYVSDITRHPEWSGGDLKIEAVTPGPAAVGQQYRSRGEVLVQKDRANQLTVTAFERPLRFEFAALDASFGKVLHEFTFTPQRGGTLMVRNVSMTMNPVMAFMFNLFVRPLIGQPMMDKAFARLKKKLESGSATS